MRSVILKMAILTAVKLACVTMPVSASDIQKIVGNVEGQLLTCLNDMRFPADFGVCLEESENTYIKYATSKFAPNTTTYQRYMSTLKACDIHITDPADYGSRAVCRLEIARNFAASDEISYLDMLNLLAKATPSTAPRAQNEQISTAPSSAYIPWTLDVEGYSPGACTQNDLALDWEGARAWAKSSILPLEDVRVRETQDVIQYTYYDPLVKRNSLRSFYKNMALCEKLRAQNAVN